MLYIYVTSWVSLMESFSFNFVSLLLSVTEMRISKAQKILIDMTYKRARLKLYLN